MNDPAPIPAREAVAGVKYRNARATAVLTLVRFDEAAGTATMKDEATGREAQVPATYLLYPMNDAPSKADALVGVDRASFDPARLADLDDDDLDKLEDADPRAWLVKAIDEEHARRADPFGADDGDAKPVAPKPAPAAAADPKPAPPAPAAPVLVNPTPDDVAANMAARDRAEPPAKAPPADDEIPYVFATEGRLFDVPLTSKIADFLAAPAPKGRGLSRWPRGYPEALTAILGKVPEFRAQVAPTDAPGAWPLAATAAALRLDVGQILQDAHDFESGRGEDLRPSFLDLLRRAHNNARKVFPGPAFDSRFADQVQAAPAPAPTKPAPAAAPATTTAADVPVTPSAVTDRPPVDDLAALPPLAQIPRVSVARALEIVDDLGDVEPADLIAARDAEAAGRNDARVVAALSTRFDRAARARVKAAQDGPQAAPRRDDAPPPPVDTSAAPAPVLAPVQAADDAAPPAAATSRSAAPDVDDNPPQAAPVVPSDDDALVAQAFAALGRAAASGALRRAGVSMTITIGGSP